MTVQELIIKLKQFNPNMKVCISDGWEGHWYPAEVNMIALNKEVLLIDVDTDPNE